MKLSLGLLALPLTLLLACSSRTDDASSSSDALSGSIIDTNGCAVEAAYTNATPADVQSSSPAGLSDLLKSKLTPDVLTVSYMNVPAAGLGEVYMFGSSSGATSFYKTDGELLATATFKNDVGTWTTSVGPLSCGDAGAP